MESVILVIHLFLALAIITLVLIQRSEGGGLGIGGGSGGGGGGLTSPKGATDILTRMTGIFAAAFFVTSLTLGVLAGGHTKADKNILDILENPSSEIQAPLDTDMDLTIKAPLSTTREAPSAPLAE